MKRLFFLFLLAILFCGCTAPTPPAQIAATTLPVYEFTCRITEGTGISVTRLVTEAVSCLHDYSLNVNQVKAAEAADIIVISGAGDDDDICGFRGFYLVYIQGIIVQAGYGFRYQTGDGNAGALCDATGEFIYRQCGGGNLSRWGGGCTAAEQYGKKKKEKKSFHMGQFLGVEW